MTVLTSEMHLQSLLLNAMLSMALEMLYATAVLVVA
jgi:hypothetical protein